LSLEGSTVLVTGGAGLIGSHVVDLCLQRGCTVRILDSLEPYVHRGAEPEGIPAGAELVVGDIRSRKDLRRSLRDVEYVFHQAAFTGSPMQAAKFFDVNATGTARLFEQMRKVGKALEKVVVASSQAVYGEGEYMCPDHGPKRPDPRPVQQLLSGDWEPSCDQCGQHMKPVPTKESSALNGTTPYALSKIAEERLSLSLGREFGVSTVALRYGVVYGPRQSFSNIHAGVISIFASRLANRLPPVIYEDGGQQRDWVFVGDIARANLFAAEEAAMDYSAFNVGTGTSATVLQIAHLLARALGSDISPKVLGGFRPGDIRHLLLDTGRLRSLGFRARTHLAEGLKRYLDWFGSLKQVREYYSGEERQLRKQGLVLSKAEES
jgi:dTDP-L-rhamnose 4-epimerase